MADQLQAKILGPSQEADGVTDLWRKCRDLPGRPGQQPLGHALDMIMLMATPADARTSDRFPHPHGTTPAAGGQQHLRV